MNVVTRGENPRKRNNNGLTKETKTNKIDLFSNILAKYIINNPYLQNSEANRGVRETHTKINSSIRSLNEQRK